MDQISKPRSKRTADDEEPSQRQLRPNELAARKRTVGSARDVRQQWITISDSRKQEFLNELERSGMSSDTLPYDYMYYLDAFHVNAYFLFTLETLSLQGNISILERESESGKPLQFVILNPLGCKGSFDHIFSMRSEECTYVPDNGISSIQNEWSAPGRGTLLRYSYPAPPIDDLPHNEMVRYDDERFNPFQSSSIPGAFSAPIPKIRGTRTFDDSTRPREEEYYVPSSFRYFTPCEISGPQVRLPEVKKDVRAILKTMKKSIDHRWKNILNWYILRADGRGNIVLSFPYPNCFSEASAKGRIFQFDDKWEAKGKDSRLLNGKDYYKQLMQFLPND